MANRRSCALLVLRCALICRSKDFMLYQEPIGNIGKDPVLLISKRAVDDGYFTDYDSVASLFSVPSTSIPEGGLNLRMRDAVKDVPVLRRIDRLVGSSQFGISDKPATYGFLLKRLQQTGRIAGFLGASAQCTVRDLTRADRLNYMMLRRLSLNSMTGSDISQSDMRSASGHMPDSAIFFQKYQSKLSVPDIQSLAQGRPEQRDAITVRELDLARLSLTIPGGGLDAAPQGLPDGAQPRGHGGDCSADPRGVRRVARRARPGTLPRSCCATSLTPVADCPADPGQGPRDQLGFGGRSLALQRPDGPDQGVQAVEDQGEAGRAPAGVRGRGAKPHRPRPRAEPHCERRFALLHPAPTDRPLRRLCRRHRTAAVPCRPRRSPGRLAIPPRWRDQGAQSSSLHARGSHQGPVSGSDLRSEVRPERLDRAADSLRRPDKANQLATHLAHVIRASSMPEPVNKADLDKINLDEPEEPEETAEDIAAVEDIVAAEDIAAAEDSAAAEDITVASAEMVEDEDDDDTDAAFFARESLLRAQTKAKHDTAVANAIQSVRRCSRFCR